MKYLLDTNVFVWWMQKNKRLPRKVEKIINDPQNTIILSVASVWEIIIKTRLKKSNISKDLIKDIDKTSFTLISIEISHVLLLEILPIFHKDPFDRILVAQSKAEQAVLITSDKQIWKYDVEVLRV